jgi:hypothetical protein
MSRKKKSEGTGPVEILPGTVEYACREHFEREKAGYEARTGIKVDYELAHPLTSTPLPAEESEESGESGESEEEEPAETGEAETIENEGD